MHSVLFSMYISLQVKQLLVGLFWTASKVTHKLEWEPIAGCHSSNRKSAVPETQY